MASPIRVTVSRTAESKARAQARKAKRQREAAKRQQQRRQEAAMKQERRQRAARIAKAAGKAGARAAIPKPVRAAVRAGRREAAMGGVEEVTIGGLSPFNDFPGAFNMAINPAQRRRARQQAGLGAATTASARAKAAAQGQRPSGPASAAVRDRAQARAGAADVNELRAQVGRKRTQLDRQHKTAQARADRLDDDLNSGRISRARAPRAAAARRKAGAESTALFFRRQRTQVAQDFLDEAKRAPNARQREALKQGAVAVLNAPLKAENGRISVPCDPGAFRRGQQRQWGGQRGSRAQGRPVAQMNGIEEVAVNGLGLPGGAYTGQDFVPQAPSGHLPISPAAGIRRGITAAGMAPFSLPAPIVVPGGSPVPPAVVVAQPHLPSFYAGVSMRTSMARPRHLPIFIPAIPPSRLPTFRVPASAQHPIYHRARLPAGAMPPKLAARISNRVVRAMGPGVVIVTPAAGAPDSEAMIPRSDVVEVPSPTATDPTEADTGWLGLDGMVGDVAGAFNEFVLSSELDNFDLGDMDGIRDKAQTFKARLRANKLRGASDADSALVATGVAAAFASGAFPSVAGAAVGAVGPALPLILGATGPLLPFALPAIVRRIMGKRADKQVSRESRLASSVGRRVTPRKRRGRRGAILRRMRAQGSAQSGCF